MDSSRQAANTADQNQPDMVERDRSGLATTKDNYRSLIRSLLYNESPWKGPGPVPPMGGNQNLSADRHLHGTRYCCCALSDAFRCSSTMVEPN